MKSFKIRVNSPEHSKKIEEHLFSLGISKDAFKVIHTEQPYIAWHEEDEKLGFIYHYFTKEFDNLPYTEVELIEKISYEFKEVSTRKVVKIGEKEYYEDELAEALKNIKPI